MSVRKGDRTESDLEVLNCAKELALYTLRAVKNERLFPKNQRWIMSQKIANECVDAVTLIRMANSVWVDTDEDYKYRRSLQVQAHAHLGGLFSLVDLAYNFNDIDSAKIEYWTKLIHDTDSKLKSWMKSEKEKRKQV